MKIEVYPSQRIINKYKLRYTIDITPIKVVFEDYSCNHLLARLDEEDRQEVLQKATELFMEEIYKLETNIERIKNIVNEEEEQ